jgi:uncharacterized protein
MEGHEREAIDAALATTAHRPWPMPTKPWIMYQRWERLLFAHWPIDAMALRSLVPPPLAIDLYDGHAWITVAPFDLAKLRGRGVPGIPGASSFPELNVRTYVRYGDKPGVFFFSLDAASPLAVMGARAAYALPYFHARMTIERDGDWIRYSSRRDGRAIFEARYRPVGETFIAQPGSRDAFLAERYALYAARGNRLLRADVHHEPWRLQRAQLEIERNTMLEVQGIDVGPHEPVLQYSERQDVLVWAPEPA